PTLNSSPIGRGSRKNHCQLIRSGSNTVLPGATCPAEPFDSENIMKRFTNFSMVVTVCTALMALAWTLPAQAQCATCPTQVVAFSPVVAPATTVTTFQPVRTGWYPGKLLDTWRMRRWGYTAPTTV